MKAIVAIVLVGLGGFLGCSGDDGTTTVGKAIPVAPFGIIDTPTPTYEWTPVPWATKYRLVVQDTYQAPTIQDAQETAIIDEWYTAEEAGCASEDGLCAVTPDIEVFDENTWEVQACATLECGPASEQLNFNSTAMNEPQFIDSGTGIVTDNTTQILWLKNANLCGKSNWLDAKTQCAKQTVGGITGWRLPTLSELRTLIEPGEVNPALPLGHPFTNVQSDLYWTSDEIAKIGNPVWLVNFYDGTVHQDDMYYLYYAWCARDSH